MSIPLVGPDLKMLALHFVVDPGADHDFSSSNSATKVKTNLSQEDSMNLLQKYLDLERIPYIESDVDSDTDRKSSGSYDSDENLGCMGKEKKKDGKGSKPSVTKQFGSLGKTVGKKLKKNFGSVGKSLKAMGPDNDKFRKNSVTQSTKVPMTIAAMIDQEQKFVWASKLYVKQTGEQNKMIENYLCSAKDRFMEERSLLKAAGDEIRRRSLGASLQDLNITGDKPLKCVNSNCNFMGNIETHYLCSKCYKEQKTASLERNKPVKDSYATYPGPSSKESEEMEKYGKSKFYTHIDDKEATELAKADIRARSNSNSTSDAKARQAGYVQINKYARQRTPSPDYDNVDYGYGYKKLMEHSPTPSPKLLPKVQNTSVNQPTTTRTSTLPGHKPDPVPTKPISAIDNTLISARPSSAQSNNRPADLSGTMHCRSKGCDFYGSPNTDYLCSACYKARQTVVKTRL